MREVLQFGQRVGDSQVESDHDGLGLVGGDAARRWREGDVGVGAVEGEVEAVRVQVEQSRERA